MFSYQQIPPDTGRERGNIMIYILIAIALFGGLTLVLMNQNKQTEGQGISDDQLVLQAKEILDYSSAVSSVIEQMLMVGTTYDQLIFLNPASANYQTLTPTYNVYHPSGGGLTVPALNKKIFTGTNTNPGAGWYLERFNNVEGTPTSANDVILTAHQISQPLCALLNKELTGSATIPTLGANTPYYLISGTLHSHGNGALTQAACGTCYDKAALCVSNTGGTMWSFYSIVGAQ